MSYNRYMAMQAGQSPDHYGHNGLSVGEPIEMGDAIEMGADSGDPCDAASAYYDPNACYNYGGTPYDSSQQGGSNPYAAPQQGNLPVDAAFCDSLVIAVPVPPPPIQFQGAQGEQVYRSQMEGYYNFLNNYVHRQTVIAPNGNFNIPFRTAQVNNSGRVYDDFYTNENHQILFFADTTSAEWQNAGLDQYCPSFLGSPTGQCQDIPGYQCQMSGADIMMGADFVLGASAPVVRHIAAKSAVAAAKQGSVVWRKMTAGENAQQKARYRAGGNSRAQQRKVPASMKAKAALASRAFNRAKSSSPYSQLKFGKPGIAVASRAARMRGEAVELGGPVRGPKPKPRPCPPDSYRNSAGGCSLKFY